MTLRVVKALTLLLVICGCGQSKPETLVTSGYDEQEMNDAIARAHKEVDTFITKLSSSTGTDHSVKVPIEDQGKIEHFWLTDVSFKDGEFTGTIGNDPGIVRNVKFGQRWTKKKLEISDWMYMQDGKLYGNYTMRPLLKTMPAEEAEQFRSMLAEP